MRPELSGQSAVRDMFTFEARLLTQFNHDNVVRAVEVGELGKDPFLVLEYLDGAPMHQIIGAAAERGVAIPFQVIATLLDGALAGLDHVHTTTKTRKGIVHCDISPYNLFATYEGAIKLIDFGIARVGTKAQRAMEVRGRYAYMSPEQALGRPFDQRADIFSIGVVLWEVIAGQRLFRRRDDETTKQALLTMRVPRLAELENVTVPDGVDEIIRMALQRDPAQRFPSAQSMRDVLAEVAMRVGGAAEPNEVAAFCSHLTGGSLLSPGVTSLAAPMRPRAFSIEIPPNHGTAPAMPIIRPDDMGFGQMLQGLAPNFTPGADIAPAFREPVNAAFAPPSPHGAADVTGALPMFEDEFTMMADGVMALRGAVAQNTPDGAMQTTGGIVHTHTPLGTQRSSPRWGVMLGACFVLFALGAGGALYYVRQQSDPDIGELALPPTPATSAAITNAVADAGAPEGVIELDSVPGEKSAPLGGGVGSGNVLSPAGSPPPAASAGEVIEMKDGYLDALAGESTEIYIDGKWTGKTPMKAHALPAGTHVIQLVRGNKSLFAQNVDIPEGEITTVDLRGTEKKKGE
jgi:serine/threonine-protein kinase